MLVYGRSRRWTGTRPIPKATSTGARRTRRCSPSSMTWSARSARTCTAADAPRSHARPGEREPGRSVGRGAGLRRGYGDRQQEDRYSTTLPEATTARTRIQRASILDAVRALKQQGEVSIGGPTLAAHAIKGGLVDEYQLFVTPLIVGGGIPALPAGSAGFPAPCGRTPLRPRRRLPALSPSRLACINHRT